MWDLTKSGLYRFLIGYSDLEDYKILLPWVQQKFTPLVSVMMYFPPLTGLPIVFLVSLLVICLYLTFTVIMTQTCTLILEDFVTWSELIHHTALVYLAIFMNLCFHITKYNLICLARQFMNGVFHYEEGLIDPVYEELKEENRKQEKKMFGIPVLIFVVSGTTLLVKPLLDYTMSVSPHPILIETNITLKSVIPLKYPHRVDDNWEAFMLSASFLLFASFVVGTIITADILFIRVVTYVALELNYLNESLRLIERRAKRLYVRRYGKKPPKDRKGSQHYQDCIAACLKENIIHHRCIKDMYEDFAAVASPAIGGGFFTCSIVMGLGMIIMNMDDVNAGDIVAFSGTVIAELMNAFMISWNSEKIGELNYELYNAVYGVKWYNWSKRNKTTIISFLDGTREPLFLRAFGLTTINMETFGSVVNTAYSFLNLVKASESMEEGK